MPLPSGKDMFLKKVVVDVSKLTEIERLHMQKRMSYWKHKDEILARMKAKYEIKKEEKIKAGIVVGKVGRPKKYKSDEEILLERATAPAQAD